MEHVVDKCYMYILVYTTHSAVSQSTAFKYSSLKPFAGKARLDSYGSARPCTAQTEQALRYFKQ